MRLYQFKSESRGELHAFTSDSTGSKLPPKFAPWQVTGMISPNRAPPHGLSRALIENGIHEAGFQLWRIKSDAKPAKS